MRAGLLSRAVNLQLVDHRFLAKEGDARFSRVLQIAAHRGTITDRYGEPLAVSTPVDSIWVNPQELALAPEQIPRLAKALKLDRQELARRITSNLDREFLYLARHCRRPRRSRSRRSASRASTARANIAATTPPAKSPARCSASPTSMMPARRAWSSPSITGWPATTAPSGSSRIATDASSRTSRASARRGPGQDLVLSIDLRIQYLAYRELKAAVRDQRAQAGSMVVLDVATGEILAMVNQPAYNPNDREQIQPAIYRNRAVTDILEPGSSIKPFFVAAGIASGRYDNHSIIDTSPGLIKVGAKIFDDEHNLGAIDIATMLAKSSNVGMAHLALTLPPQESSGPR